MMDCALLFGSSLAGVEVLANRRPEAGEAATPARRAEVDAAERESVRSANDMASLVDALSWTSCAFEWLVGAEVESWMRQFDGEAARERLFFLRRHCL